MKIVKIETVGLAFALSSQNARAEGDVQVQREVTLVRLTTEDGIEGVGEALGSFDLIKPNVNALARTFLHTDIFERDVTIGRVGDLKGAMVAAYSGLNIAMLDALGQALKLPVCRLIGGMARSEVAGYASGGRLTGCHLTHCPVSVYEEQLERIRASKIPTAKIQIGLGPAADEERVRIARHHLGEGATIAVDANANYTADVALESMNRVARYGIAWFGEPLPAGETAGYAQLRSRAPVAIAAGHGYRTAHDFRMLLEGDCIDIAQPSVSGCGGLDEARRISDLCRLNSRRVMASAGTSGVGFAAAVHFAASVPDYPHSQYAATPPLVECDITDNPAHEGVLAERLCFNAGNVVVPASPGLGIALNHDFIKRHAIV